MTKTSTEDPVDVLPDEEDEPISRAMLVEAYSLSDPPTDGWINRGDQGNTAIDGGMWITYDPDSNSWEIVHTEHVQSIFADADSFAYDDPGEQYVQYGKVDLADIVTEDGNWTEEVQKFRKGLDWSHSEPVGVIVDDLLTDFVVHFATNQNLHTEPVSPHIPDSIDIHEPGIVIRDDYESVLEYMDVTPADDEL